MACFDNIVTLKELCTETDPVSGIYLNDVGITKKFIESVITSDYTDTEAFVTSKVNHALRVVQNSIHSKYGNKINSSSLLTDHRLGFTQSNMVEVAGGGWKGIKLALNNSSNYITLNLSSVSLQVNHNGTIPVLIYDLYQNKLLDTVSVTAVSGEIVTVYPHKKIESDGRPLNLFIGYNAAGINSITTYLRKDQCCGISCCTTSYLTAQGVTNSTGTFIDEDTTPINHTGGVSIVYSLNCNSFSWMCSYAQVLALPIAYKAASEIYQHGIQNALNSRSSNNVNLNPDEMKATKDFYELQFREQLDSILQNMNLPKDSVCFQCKTPSKTAIILP